MKFSEEIKDLDMYDFYLLHTRIIETVQELEKENEEQKNILIKCKDVIKQYNKLLDEITKQMPNHISKKIKEKQEKLKEQK